MDKNRWFFHIKTGAYDSADVYGSVGIFLLDKIREKYGKNSIGLYHLYII